MWQLFSRKGFALFPIALVLIIAACSSGGDDDASDQSSIQDQAANQTSAVAAESAGDEEDAPATSQAGGDDEDDRGAAPALADDSDYARALRALVDDIELKLDAATEDFQDEAFDLLADVDLDDENALNQVLLEALDTFGPRVIEIIEGSLDDLADLDPPDRFQDDHDRFVATVRDLFQLQSGLFDRVRDGDLSVDQELDDLTARIEALKADLRDSISPEFFNIIAPFFDEDTETLAEIGGDDGVSINQGDTSITAGGNLPDSYPDELIPPNGSLESALSGTENGVESIVAFWTSTTDPGDLLDFFQDAFDELGIEGEQDRLEAGDFNALSISDPDGEPLAGVLVSPSADSESYDVIVTIIGS